MKLKQTVFPPAPALKGTSADTTPAPTVSTAPTPLVEGELARFPLQEGEQLVWSDHSMLRVTPVPDAAQLGLPVPEPIQEAV